MAGKFEVYKDRAGKFRFRLKASNGQVVATGEAYESKSAAIKGCEWVENAATGATVVEAGAHTHPNAMRSSQKSSSSRSPRISTSAPATGSRR
jgi:uncharacterized protein